ncbi:hypothetical protein JW752_05290, partial [Candidatus Peregrinibacteria bacterium]|nr:hypothetical protein [Candidatus Peregrinibacteria bacterium]
QIAAETDEEKKRRLRDKKKTCREHLDVMRKVPKGAWDMEQALKDWELENRRLKNLDREDLSYLYLDDLMETDMGDFFDEETLARIQIGSEQMKRADFLLRTTQPITPESLRLEAAEYWTERKGELEEALREATEKSQDASLSETERERQADYARSVQEELKTKSAWIEDKSFEIERKKHFELRDRVPEEDIDRIRSFVIEARGLRENAILASFNAQMEVNRKRFIKLAKKKPPRLSDDQIKDTLRFMEGVETETLKDPDLFRQSTDHLRKIQASLDKVSRDVDELERELSLFDRLKTQEGKEDFRKEMMTKADAVKTAAAAFTPERTNGFIEALETARQEGRVVPSEYKKFRKVLEWFRDSQIELNDIDEQIRNIHQLPPEEVIDIKRYLDRLQEICLHITPEKLDQALGIKKLSDAQLARKVIQKIKDITDSKTLRTKLEAELGETHVNFINDDAFKPYASHSETGFMVFWEHGDDWKIIINEDAIQDGQRFQHDVTHELLHLEFERNPGLKEEWVKRYTQARNWKEIKQKFAEAYPKKRPARYEGTAKTAYTADDWEDQDVVSELYAMQNDIEGALQPGKKSKLSALRQAILGSGIAASALGIPEKIAAPIIRGAEEGDVKALMGKAGKGEEEAEGGAETEGMASPEKHKESLTKIDGEIKKYLNSEYLDYIPGAASLLRTMRDFSEDTAELNEAFAKTKSNFLSVEIGKRIKQLNEALSSIKSEIERISTDVPNQIISPFRRLWNNTSFLSLEEVWQVGVDILEWNSRRHKRKMADHAGRLGSALFENMPFLGDIGLEAEARRQKAEAEEVNEWKSRLENKDAWELLDIVKDIAHAVDPNKDQLKAVLRILADKGRINWRDKHLWIALNKLQSAVHLSPDDEMILSNPTILRQKLHTACGEIWDYDEYLSLERNNEGKYESSKKEHMESIHKIQRQIGQRLEQLYKKHKSGGQVEPMEYEALLEYSIIYGKCYSEAVMFYLIAGVAEGILPPDRPMVLDKYLNEFPTIEYSTEEYAPKSQTGAQKICETYFKDDFKNGIVGDQFKNYYWTVIQNSQQVLERVRKSAPERKWDHDWSRGIAAMCDAASMKTFLSGKSGEIVTKSTAMENMYVGMLQWFEENAVNPESRNWRPGFHRAIASFLMAEGLRNWVAYRDDPKYQRGEGIMGNTARENAVSNHGEWNVGQHVAKMQKFVGTFSDGLAGFYALITDTAGASQADPDKKGQATDHLNRIKVYLSRFPGVGAIVSSFNTLNDIFNNMDNIVTGILGQVDDATFLNRIATVKK